MSQYQYGKVDREVLERLRLILGEQFVITDEEKMEPYSHDEVAEAEYAHMPEVVVKPRTAEEIAAIVRLANEKRIPVTPRGAGSGLSGGAVPLYGGILLSMERMNRILEIDERNMMVVVEPGVVTNEINNRIKDLGLFFAGYPMSLETCYVGGNVAENAGGGKAVKYGVTERYIMGIEMVTPTGEIVSFGGKRMKDVSGYNIRMLMVGSEGTLGIITKVIIKLLPLPKAKVDLLALFPDVQTAISVVPKIMTQGGIIPTAIEFMDQLSVHTSCNYLNEKIPYQQAGAMLLIEVDGTNEQVVEGEYDTIGNLCMDNGAQEVYVADNYTTQERLWSVRRNIAEAFKVVSPHQSLEDIVVPTAQIPDLMPEIARISKKYDIQIPCYGHAGDGNLHATLIKNPSHTMEQWYGIIPPALEELYIAAKKLGGTISGEHGIGHKRKKYMHIVNTDAELEFMRKIKRAVDPNNIMNPGKILDV
ncbi:MAG: FAD-linked oxidase C-terminal domain-containing protein [Candidatus Latescibacter sp.]|nr:FAD-linked oxidase C-terminal domain-containing protein [Candidatus Latescibacter sp.]